MFTNCSIFNAAEQKWTLLGDVVGNNETTKPGGKAMHDGKEYDYVFNIDIGEGMPSLKLPYNNNQDPYHVAQVIIIPRFARPLRGC